MKLEGARRAFDELSQIDGGLDAAIHRRCGRPEREFNGPVVGLQARYRAGLAVLGVDFAGLPDDERRARLERSPEFTALLYEHACEGMYGAPEYGGNQGLVGWRYIGYEGDVQPRGYTDDEVAGP